MAVPSLQSVDSRTQSLTLFSNIGGGFSHPEGNGICTLQELLRTIQPLRLQLYEGADFKDKSQLGEGASYRVFRYTHRGSKHLVAVKEVKLPSDPSQRDAFQKRVRCVLKDIEVMHHPPIAQHENILTLLGYGWGLPGGGALPFLATEYSGYGTLRNFFRSPEGQRLTMIGKVQLTSHVASGLHAMHVCGIAHGDLKLENVLIFPRSGSPSTPCEDDKPTSLSNRKIVKLDMEYTAKLSDFGHSCLFSPDQASGSRQSYRGTTGYLAPEIFELQEGAVNAQKCDVWAFGLLAWETWAGGTRYTELEGVRALTKSIRSGHSSVTCTTKASDEDSYVRVDLSSKDDETSKSHILTGQLLPLAEHFTETAMSGLSLVHRRLLRAVFRKTLQIDPAKRCDDVSKLPLVYGSFASELPTGLNYRLTERDMGNSKWSFEDFLPFNVVSMPQKAKLQLVADAKMTPHASENALFVAFAYATGFGVSRSFSEFRSWTQKAASHGSGAAAMLIEILESPDTSARVIRRELIKTLTIPSVAKNRSLCGIQTVPTTRGSHASLVSSHGCTLLHFLPLLMREEEADVQKLHACAHENLSDFLPASKLQSRFRAVRFGRTYASTGIDRCTSEPHLVYERFPLTLYGSPLAFAVALRCPDTVKELVKHGASTLPTNLVASHWNFDSLPPFENGHGRFSTTTPLQTAVSCHLVDMFEHLWSNTIDAYGRDKMRRRIINDSKTGALLVASLAERSPLERIVLHGPNYILIQSTMIRALVQAMYELNQDSRPEEVGLVFTKGLKEVLKLGELDIARELRILIHFEAMTYPTGRVLREQVFHVALHMACSGTLAAADSEAFLTFARELGEDLDPDFLILKKIIDRKDSTLFERYLRRSVKVNAQDRTGKTLLHIMVESGFHEECSVGRLLTVGANPNTPDSHGCSPLHYAASNGLTSTIGELLNEGANPAATDSSGSSILKCAVLSRNAGCVDRVLQALTRRLEDEEVSHESQNAAKQRHHIIAFGTFESLGGDYKPTTLHHAAEIQDLEILSLLLRYGASPHFVDSDGNTALHRLTSTQGNSLPQVIACCQVLLQAGSRYNAHNRAGMTPVHLAAQTWKANDLEDILTCFMKHQDTSLDVQDVEGQTVLYHASASGRESTVATVLQLGGSPHPRDKTGLTALHACAKASQPTIKSSSNSSTGMRLTRIATLLLAAGADPSIRDSHDRSPMDYAAMNDSLSMFRQFAQVSAKLTRYCNTRVYDQSTASTSKARMIASAWKVAVEAESWLVVKEIARTEPASQLDFSLLSWPAGAHLFKHMVEEHDTELLKLYGKTLNPSDYANGTENRESLLGRDRDTYWHHLPLELQRSALLTKGWYHEQLRLWEADRYHSQIHKGGHPLYEIYESIQRWDEKIIYMYFHADFWIVALEFLGRRRTAAASPFDASEVTEFRPYYIEPPEETLPKPKRSSLLSLFRYNSVN